MIVFDVNVIVYAFNARAPERRVAAAWLEGTLGGSEMVGVPVPAIWAFIRLFTNDRLWPKPHSVAEVFGVIRDLLASPQVVLLQPGPRHLEILERLVEAHNAKGPLVSDAVIAAIAIENDATVATTDRDFSRFTEVRCVNPLAPR